jgi:hypothetical protein
VALLPASKFYCRALVAQQSSASLHLASAAVSEEAGVVGVPLFEMAKTNPMRVAAAHADVDRARFWAVDVAAVVSDDSP